MKRALLILLLLSPFYVFSQKTNSGTEFWMAFMRNYDSTYGGKRDSLRLYISATATSNVTISIPLQSYIGTITVPKDSVVVYLIPLSLGYLTEFDQVLDKGIHITSDFPISVSAMNLLYATTDASIVLPYANIPSGTTYVSGNPSAGSTSEVLLVAGQDSTDIEITPSVITQSGLPKKVPFRLRLNKGQVYQLGGKGDLTGTVVKVLSPHKLVAFTGDRCSNWPCGACDHEFEQILPNDVLDTAYCIPSHFGHVNGYFLKMVPLDTNTDIRVNGVTYKNVSRLKPLEINVHGDSGYYASSSKLFHCHQFLKGANCSGYINNSYGDPAQLEMVSNKYFGESSLFSTVNSFNLKDHFVNLVIKTTAKNNVYLDKTKIDSSEFIPFLYKKDFSFAKLKISIGQHLVECSDGLLAYCYGVGFYESYLYLAGFSLPNFDLDFKDSVMTYDCKNQKINMQFRARSEKKLKKYTWTFGDNTTGTGNPVQHLYNQTGNYTVKLVAEDFSGKKDSIIKKIKVSWPDFDPVRNKIICGIDTITFIEKNPFFTNFKWQDNSTQNYYKAWTNTNVKVIATDTSGYCKFSDSGVVSKIEIFSDIKVDSIEKCWKYNQFVFTDSSKIFADDILHKAWVFPWTTIWDKPKTTVRFPMPGKYKVYFDIYTTQANCKARYPIDITVHPMPKVYAKVSGREFCANSPILFYDSSQIVTGYIKKAKWNFDDGTSVESDSLKTLKQFSFNLSINVIRFYNHIAISDKNCSDTVLNAVEVYPKPKADFTLTSPDTILCLPSARWTFKSTSTVIVDTMALFWDAGNGRTSTNYTMANIRYFNPGKYKVRLKAVSAMGCIDSMVKNIEVVPIPKAAFVINDSSQCYNNHLFNFKDTSIGTHLNYSWTLGNGNTASSANVDSVKYSTSGNHTVQLKITTLYIGCEDSVLHHLIIFKEPLAQIKGNKDTQCLSGNKFNIMNTSVFYQNYQSSKWNYKNGSDTNFNLINFSFTDTGNFPVQLIVKDMEGCTDTTQTFLKIIPQPLPFLTINDSIQCFYNNRFVFRTNNLHQETNQWKVNNKIIYTGTEDSVSYIETKAGINTIRLMRQTSGGCIDSIRKYFWLLEAPKTAFNLNKDSQCLSNNSFDFTDASTAKNDNINAWKYVIDNTVYSGQKNLTNISFSTDGNKSAKLIIKTNEGCMDSLSKNLVVLSNPNALITGDSICLNEEANISATQISGQPIIRWDWDLGDGTFLNTQSGKHLYRNPSNYNLSLTIADNYGCSNTINLPNGVLVYALPNATFNFTETAGGPNESLLKFHPVLNPAYQFLWQFPDGTNSAKDTPTLLVDRLLKGDIFLTVTNAYGCKDNTSQSIYIYPNNFNVYIPNAISLNNDELNDVFKIEGLKNAQDYKMQIINRWGEELFVSYDAAIGWDGTYKGEYVPEGVYAYAISFKYYDGKKYNYKGTITLLR